MSALRHTFGIAAVASTLMFAGSFISAQDTTKSETKPAAKKAARRLPANFGKLDLASEQKEKVLEIQASYAAKIDELRKELETVRAKQNAEIETVLKPEQLKKLKELRAAAKAKSAKAKAETAAESTTETKTPPPPAATPPAKSATEKK